MPRNKDLKRLVRTRMKKTGESYTTARMQLTKTNKPRKSAIPEKDHAHLAGMSDDAVRAKTGKTWKQWVRVLDAIDAVDMPHRDIARYVHDEYDIPGWWAQTVTVGYERIRGLRDIGQRRGGGYEANKSRTFPVSVIELYRAFTSATARARWLPGVALRVRTTIPNKSMRISWPDGTDVQLYLVAKGKEKSQLAVQHTKLTSKPEVTKRKAYWSERLDALASILERR